MPERRRRGAERTNAVWSGRIAAHASPAAERYLSGFDVDWRLLPDDITATQAHAAMLQSIGLLTREEHAQIERALRAVADEVSAGRFELVDGDEDIHTALERRLTELAGAAGARIHTGRSRNDQVVTALRLHCKRVCAVLVLQVAALQDALVHQAEEHRNTVMPGYTHLQRAQPVSLAHHLLAYVEMLQRDVTRLIEARTRCDVLPLGSGALAGSTLPLDRQQVRQRLGFAAVSFNSMDAVADRDFAVEIAFACALLMAHLSRLAEELVLWSSSEFAFVAFPDSHATGSSLMPQKKNPDLAEVARARTGRVTGAVVALLVMLKGLPLAYNRDLQEDKRALFEALDVTRETVEVMTELLPLLRFDADSMRRAASDPALLATDAAEYLVQRGMPFRDAHRAVGELVRQTMEETRTLSDVTLEEWRAVWSDVDAEDIAELFDIDHALRRRDLTGGPGPRSVSHQLARATDLVDETRKHLGELE